jgi:hypothetical protein
MRSAAAAPGVDFEIAIEPMVAAKRSLIGRNSSVAAGSSTLC